MPPSLHSQLTALASSFADAVLDVLRSTPLDELVEDTPRSRGATDGRPTPAPPASPQSSTRLHRRSAEEIALALAGIVALLKKQKGGLRAEDIRVQLGMQAKELPRVLKQGLDTNVIQSTGQKRATTYFPS